MEIVPLTIWREARGEGNDGMRAVAFVIRNRALNKFYPNDPEHVCLQRKQFSCWNDANAERDLYPAKGDESYEMACRIWEDLGATDPTNEALFYVNPKVLVTNPFDDPRYVVSAVIGRHTFYKLK